MRHLADIITISRGLAAFFLLAFPPFGWAFWTIYAWCGLSDMLDGTIARKTGNESKRGALLDSIADLLFLSICFARILPLIVLPMWLWIWVIAIAIVKLFTWISALLSSGRIERLHSIANKVTGILLFLLPIGFLWLSPLLPTVLVCLVATYVAVSEIVTIYILKRDNNLKKHEQFK